MSSQNSVQHAQPSDLTAHTKRTVALLAPRHEDAIVACPMPTLVEEEAPNATAEMYLSNVGYAIPPRPPYALNKGLRPSLPPKGVA